MEKIDFFGGAHGNFLELVINLFIYQVKVDNPDSFFNETGAAHVKDNLTNYHPIIKCSHYSYNNAPFDLNDQVIEIHCDPNDMLVALTNSLTRAGDQTIDLDALHLGTIKKLSVLPKASLLLKDIIDENGVLDNYPKSVIRNYFYSKFDIPEYGFKLFNTFKHQGEKYVFPFSAFFSIEDFYLQLNQCAFFLNLNFYPNKYTSQIWQEFMDKNQGNHSQVKCNRIMSAILKQESMNITGLNLVEEAWIIHRLTQIFRCYDNALLKTENFPTNTVDITTMIYEWKQKDYPEQS